MKDNEQRSSFEYESPKDAYSEAERRIKRVLGDGSDSLDLSNLGLEALPLLPAHFPTTLCALDLSHNRLNIFPESIRSLKALRDLDLGDNLLSAIPEWIGDLTALRELALYANKIASLPCSLSNLGNLKELGLGGNELAGTQYWGISKVCQPPASR
jgi:Leucine-rich repeat (LRR) protein